MHEAISLYVPLFRSRTHAYSQWFSPGLHHALNKLHNLCRKFRKSFTADHATSLFQAESQFQKGILGAKLSYESRLINDYVTTDNSKIFKYVHSITKQDFISSSVSCNHQSAISNTNKANLFNSFFHSMLNNSHIPLPRLDPLPVPASSLDSTSITFEKVIDSLVSLILQKPLGPMVT